MCEMYIRSQNREKLYRFDCNYVCVEYDKCQKTNGETLHKLYISGGNSEEIGTYKTKERCLEIIDEIQKMCVFRLCSNDQIIEIPRIYEIPEK